MILPIYVYGTDVLRQETKDIAPNYPNLYKLIEDMFETMYASEGVGLAAPQVGKAIRLFVVDADALKDDFPECKGFKRAFINPEIVSFSDKLCTMSEGCLSIPGLSEEVERPESITIKYLDEDFNEHEEVLTSFNARVVQHEYDHLEQILFTDRIKPMRKAIIRGKLSKMSRGKVHADYRVITK